jgi:2-iminobutanoate/2-iminopropanoate deaminase
MLLGQPAANEPHRSRMESCVARPRTEISNPEGAPPALRPYYSTAVRVTAGDLLFISGQVAWDAAGQVVGKGDPVRQAEQVFANLQCILDAHDAGFEDIVKVTVYVTDLSWFEQLSDIRLRLFSQSPPASVIVQVAALVHPDLLLEVDAVVAV